MLVRSVRSGGKSGAVEVCLQLDDVADDSHDDEAHADGLGDLDYGLVRTVLLYRRGKSTH